MNLPIVVELDSSAAKGAAERLGTTKIKHMQIKQMFIKDLVKTKVISLKKIGTGENRADLLTKGLPQQALQHALGLLRGVCHDDGRDKLDDMQDT